MWDLRTGEQLRQLEGHKDAISSVKILEKRCMSSSFDKVTFYVHHTRRTTIVAFARSVSLSLRSRRLLQRRLCGFGIGALASASVFSRATRMPSRPSICSERSARITLLLVLLVLRHLSRFFSAYLVAFAAGRQLRLDRSS